jgi:hypothetical protein
VIDVILQVAQVLGGDNSEIGMILQTLFSLSFIIYLFYAQRIQAMTMLRQVEVTLRKVKTIKDEGRRVAIEMVKEVGKPERDPTPDVDRFLEQFVISPVSMDPAGIMGKLDQLINVSDYTNEAEVKAIAPQATETEAHNIENLLGAAHALNYYYKAIRHFYLLGKKTMNVYIIMQIHMILPLIMKEIEATSSAIQAFRNGMPIGDGVGPLVVSKLMRGHELIDVARETVAAWVPYEGRTLILLKAKGPGGSVGKPGDGVAKILGDDKKEKKITAVIMIDAAGKLEGEPVGEIAEGFGAAIGGVGVEKYKIEEAVKARNIPMYAIAIKQDISHVIAPLVEELYKATDKALESVKRIVTERTQEGDYILVAGIGNTMGIAQ